MMILPHLTAQVGRIAMSSEQVRINSGLKNGLVTLHEVLRYFVSLLLMQLLRNSTGCLSRTSTQLELDHSIGQARLPSRPHLPGWKLRYFVHEPVDPL